MAHPTSSQSSGVDQLQSGLHNMAISSSDSAAVASHVPDTSPAGPAKSPRATKKRPNQAQRRNMNSQFVIPVDTRPQYSSGAPFNNDPWQNNRDQSWNHRPNSNNAYGQRQDANNFQRSGPGFRAPPPHFGQQYNQPRPQQFHQQFPNRQAGPGHQQNWGQQGQQGQYAQAPRYQSHQPTNSRGNNFMPSQYPPGPQQPHAPMSNQAAAPRLATGQNHQNGNGGGWSSHQAPRPNSGYRQNGQDGLAKGIAYLEKISEAALEDAGISPDDLASKNEFRVMLEKIARDAIAQYEQGTNENPDFPPESVELRCFGSVASGFATKGSDMDLGLVTPLSIPKPADPGSEIPRLIEKALLDHGFGARLLTRTRIPIIKLCEKPTPELYQKLLSEREKWEKGDDFEASSNSDSPDNANVAGSTSSQPEEVPVSSHDSSEATSPDSKSADTATLLVQHGKIHLSQQSTQSLNSYYTIARRLMVQLGISDLDEYSKEVPANTMLTLSRVCCAFVGGITDEALRSRLSSRPYARFSEAESDLSVPVVDSTPGDTITPKSLATLYHLAEAEELLARWDSRPSDLQGDDVEAGGVAMAAEITAVLNKECTTVASSVALGREVHAVISRFKQLAIVQVVTMEQRANEFATDYYNRACRLLRNLGPGTRGGPMSAVQNFFLLHFCHGVHRPEIRAILLEFYTQWMTYPHMSPTLADLALRLKTLQLADDFEVALDKEMYSDYESKLIREYVQVIRRPLAKLNTAGTKSWYKYALPLSHTERNLVDQIRSVTDPSVVHQNKERFRDELEFPKDGVGAQCDINFSANLALQNSLLLRCYSHTDPRVRQLGLFVKRWAKLRQINTPYRGSLSSYGYVLMVIHYLVNVVEPFVCPNLQAMAGQNGGKETGADVVGCDGYDVRFMRDEEALIKACSENKITTNTDSIGKLLCGFFEYYAQPGTMTTIPGRRGFDWGREVLSLRTSPGGILTKQEKGWTGAKTILVVDGPNNISPTNRRPSMTTSEVPTLTTTKNDKPTSSTAEQAPATAPEGNDVSLKEVRCRYLFAIEDPFEIDHNIARTVTHHGISSIRDEFRRAWRLIQAARSGPPGEDLMEAISLESQQDKNFVALIDSIHAHSSPGL